MNTRVPRRSVCGLFVCLVAFCFPMNRVRALDTVDTPTAFRTPVTAENLDPTTYAVWSDGREVPVSEPLRNALWTQNTEPEWNGLMFGVRNWLGVRALRYGFKTAVPVGCVLVRGNVAVSVLRSGAAYPGRLGNDADWLPAQRLSGQGLREREAGVEDEALWILPPGTQTRALRFVHTPAATDTRYEGILLGAFVFAERFANVAPQAQAKASANDEIASRINNESADGTWNAWDNTKREDRKQPLISPTHPESVTLTWRKPVALRGLCLLGSGFRTGDVAVLSSKADPLHPTDADWATIKTFVGWSSRYPLSLGPNFLVFDQAVTTKAIRLRMTGTIDESAHPHLGGTTAEGRRVWLGELMTLSPLREATLADAIQSIPPEKTTHPPIPVRFTLAAPGFVTLVIEDGQGRRVRNLIANTFYDRAGANVAWWDGLDDLGRDVDAAHHGVYHVPGQLVTPGDYRVRGLVHPQIDLRYQMSVYSGGGTPPWETADHMGGWTTNHTPPQSVLAVPPTTPTDKPHVMIGSYVAEGGDGLAWVDLSGRKTDGEGHVGGSWTGAPFLARDAGSHAAADVSAYVGAAWSADAAPGSAEIRLNAVTPDGDRLVLNYIYVPTPENNRSAAGEGQSRDYPAEMDGLAARDGLLVVALRKQNRLLFVDANLHRAIGLAAMPDPRGLAFDASGRLLALSGKTLRRVAVPPALQAGICRNAPDWTATASLHPDDAAKALGTDRRARWSTLDWQSPGQSFTVDMKRPVAVSTLVLEADPAGDSPRGYSLYASLDGADWGVPIAQGEGTPRVTTIDFPLQTARYLKIVQTGTNRQAYWSINRLAVYQANPPMPSAPTPQPLKKLSETNALVTNLEDPSGITLDDRGDIYVSDRGGSHQVKVFSPEGAFLRSIGKPGAPRTGPYDPLHMNDPQGVAIDAQNHLWVAEASYQPKRVSVWTLDGTLLRAFYGPARYGGGGTLDPRDPTRFRYEGMEFKIDQKSGTSQLVDVFCRPGDGGFPMPDGYDDGALPQTPIYAHDREYLTNCYTSHPTNGTSIALLWRMENGVAVPVAALGRANEWNLLKQMEFRSRLPQGVDLNGSRDANECLFVWSDVNGDGKVEPEEVQFRKAHVGGVTVGSDLSFVESRVEDQVTRFAPARFTAEGAPVYDLTAGRVLALGAQPAVSTGGDQALQSPDGFTVSYPPPHPFSPFSIGGSRGGVPLWSYPNLWPGLHAGHEAPTADRPGELIAPTRLLGGFVTPRGSDVGSLFALNGNMGSIYLFTADGLFVTELFQDVRVGKSWTMPTASPGMLLNDVSLHDENFFPSITQTGDGAIYLVDGGRSSLVRVDGLNALRRLSNVPLHVSAADLKAAQTFATQAEAERQGQMVRSPLRVARVTAPPTLDGDLIVWTSAEWATIDKRGVAAFFNSDSQPYNVQAAVACTNDTLYAAFKTSDPNLLRNTAADPRFAFKSGGALDLMLDALPGGERLLVTQIGGKTKAILYRAHVPGTAAPVAFSSPSRTISLDRVDDVSDQVRLSADGKGNFQIAAPLAALALTPRPGASLRADIGILRGDGFQTLQRVYWSNKATSITADVPSEAELTPQLWGTWIFE